MPVGAKSLWPEKNMEVAVVGLDIGLHVRHGLRAINDHPRKPLTVGHRGSCSCTGTTVPRALETWAMETRGARAQGVFHTLQVDDLPCVVDRGHAEAGCPFPAHSICHGTMLA